MEKTHVAEKLQRNNSSHLINLIATHHQRGVMEFSNLPCYTML